LYKKEFGFILQEGEGLKIEFKESFDKSIGKEIVAFANSEGGRIFLGVNDKGEIKGIDITNKLKSQIQDLARNCDPQVEIKLEGFDKILIIEVIKGKDKPYKCKEGFYLRQGPNSQKMSRDRIISLAIDEGKIRFDEQINKDFEFKKNFDNERLNHYLDLARISKNLSNEKMLFELGVAKKNKSLKFNNVGVLFFAKNPQQFISHSVFSCVLFKDEEGTDIIDRKEVTGSLIEIIEEVMKFIKKNVRVAYKFTGKPRRENIYEYPLEAIREAIINSVMHRDYFEAGHNNLLRIFPNKLAITNVWLKPSWFKIGRDTFRRNKIIADLFLRIELIEKLGTGFERMRNFCKKVNAPLYKLDIDEKYFRIMFFKSRDYLDLAEKVPEKVPEKRLKIILENIEINKKITVVGLADILNVNEKTIKRDVEKLKKKGLLKRVGPAKGGYWEIVKRG